MFAHMRRTIFSINIYSFIGSLSSVHANSTPTIANAGVPLPMRPPIDESAQRMLAILFLPNVLSHDLQSTAVCSTAMPSNK